MVWVILIIETQIIEVVMYYYPMYLGPVLGILTESVKKPNVVS